MGKRKPKQPGTAATPRGDSIAAGEFKARCLELVNQVRERRAELVITRHNKAVAKLVPVAEHAAEIFGHLKGTVTYSGDIVAPTGESWHAER